MGFKIIESIDPEIANAIAMEVDRQKYTLELIASENITSPAVMATQASVLTNKYAEGYPDKRYYGGCEYVDVAEKLAIDRAKKLFNAAYANVQPHSGSQANMAVYFALLSPGDTVLGMNLSHGGHLTHGSPASFSGKIYNFVHYGVDRDTETIDYNEVQYLAEKYRPKLIVAGASAYPRIIDFEIFSKIAESVQAYFMVDMAHIAGLVATGLHDYSAKLNREIFPGIQGGPLMHIIAAKAVALREAMDETFRTYQINVIKNAKALADHLMEGGIKLVSDGTDNHMLIADLRNLEITGRDAEDALGLAGITVNKNAIPFETLSPAITSGIRIGTPAVTTRGMKEAEMHTIATFIIDVLKDHENDALLKETKAKVRKLCESFPLYEDLSDC